MEAYLSAAGKISRLAIGTETAPTLAVFDAPHDTSQNDYVEGLPFGTRGGMLIQHEFPADGEYTFTVKGMTGYFTAVLGNVKGEKLETLCKPILDCLNDTRCIKTYCGATTIRQGWVLESARR